MKPLDEAYALDMEHEKAYETCVEKLARLHLVARQLEGPSEGSPLPYWAVEFMDRLGGALRPRALESFERLVRGVVALSESTPKAEACTVGHLGTPAIEVAWDVPSRLTWLIMYPPHAWPIVKVRLYTRVSDDGPAMHARTFMLAHRVVLTSVLAMGRREATDSENRATTRTG